MTTTFKPPLLRIMLLPYSVLKENLFDMQPSNWMTVIEPSPRLKAGDSRVHITSLWLSSSQITSSTASVIVASD